MIATRLSDPVAITLIAAVWFLLLALIAVSRTVMRKVPPISHRFRVGIFIERDHKTSDEDTDDEQRAQPRD